MSSPEITRYAQIMCEMQELLDEAYEIVGSVGSEMTQARMRGYWYAHIMGAVDKESSEFLGGSMVDMAQTYEELCEDAKECA